ncbi:MAG: transcription-repair coupling factor [Euryarchaeota archaeon]|nr:transcription-repair coupling factor [Euryarchaeota archaeon]
MNSFSENNFFINTNTSHSIEIGRIFYEHLSSKKQSLNIFTGNVFEAIRLKEEISWFYPKLRVNHFPDWETLPYDQISPHPDLISERLLTLYQMTQREFDINLLPLSTSLHLLPPRSYIEKFSFNFKTNQAVDINAFKNRLVDNGYLYVEKVMNPGEFAMRGGIIDIFPMGSIVPYRIDFFDNEIESIRTFDVDTQRSLYPTNKIKLLPARECPLDDEGVGIFRNNYREKFEGDLSKSKIYKSITKSTPFAGMEWYLPLFFEQTNSIFDYIEPKDAVLLLGDTAKAASDYWSETASRYRLYAYDTERPILEPNEFLIPPDQFFKKIKDYPQIKKHKDRIKSIKDIAIDRDESPPLHKLSKLISKSTQRILLCAEGLGRRESLADLLKQSDIQFKLVEDWNAFIDSHEKVCLIAGPLHDGFSYSNYLIITENEIFPNFVRQIKKSKRNKSFSSDGIVKDLTELSIGDPIVHEQHGVGRYKGLVDLDYGEGINEFLELHYEREDKLYVPVSQLYLISRYSGGPIESAPIHKLGSGSWEKAKKKALTQIHDTAAELLDLYAKRSLQKGVSSKINLNDYDAFVDGFPFEETADQKDAIERVVEDMESSRPMDRLVCGDVGFGKTEVALRAAFISVLNGKQAIVLVPTTLLAEQHFDNFCDRFARWPIKIEEISRFKSKKQQYESLQRLHEGKIDIIIGTHRLLQPDVKFKDLGLVVIDEEHRFGVRQKEKLKAFRKNVDVLALTATPIPRTLSLAMEGLREFSVIATPPQKRLSIKTFVVNFSQGIIKEAVLREFNRGGQVYFLHNEVNTIQLMFEKLSKLLPEAKIGVAHGQLREKELEHVMQDFHQQRINILLCSTIIETGIDIPTANTIIMNRADKFGLAQLHQLRGRVGRSHHQAYAYLLIDEDRKLTSNAKKRLEAIQLMEDLGAGYHLAMHDLEIRGAGELLGDNQSGQMHEIGFNLYIDMLNNAIKQLKKGEKLDLESPITSNKEINLHTPTILTQTYCPNTNERLIIYKRLSSCKSKDELKSIKEELIDRFGIMPLQTVNLILFHELRINILSTEVMKIDSSKRKSEITIKKNADIDPIKIIDLLQNDQRFKMNGPDKIKILLEEEDVARRVKFITKTINEITV